MLIAVLVFPIFVIESNRPHIVNMTVIVFLPVAFMDDHEHSDDDDFNNIDNDRNEEESIIEGGEHVAIVVPDDDALNKTKQGGQSLKVD